MKTAPHLAGKSGGNIEIMKKQLAYSSLSDEVFYIDGRGQKTQLPKGNFIQMVLLWLNEGKNQEVGEKFQRELTSNGAVHFRITIERLAK